MHLPRLHALFLPYGETLTTWPLASPSPLLWERRLSDSGWKTVPETPDYLLSPVATVTYTYDKVGNRLTETRDGLETHYLYDRANRLTNTGSASFSYDAAGNLTGESNGEKAVAYAYNAAGKMTRATLEDETYVEYGYDAFGRKVRRTESASGVWRHGLQRGQFCPELRRWIYPG